jgi:diadenosine tetraphosphate (Ap4A) HIT family hydrolase
MDAMVVGHPHDAEAGDGGCLACAKHRGEVGVAGGDIYRDDLVYVSHVTPRDGTTDVYLGYVIVETQRHAPGLADLSTAEGQAVGVWVVRMARALTEVVGVEHVYAFVLGHEVRHFHEHVVARYPGAPQEYWGIRVTDWPDAPRGDASAVAALSDRLRGWLADAAVPAH